MQTLDKFTQAYIQTALWSTTDRADETGGDPLDHNYSPSDISPDCLAAMVADCAKFQASEGVSGMIMRGYEWADLWCAGHDFWLTREGHGAGFWDGDWADGERLTELSKTFGAFDLYVGDDGQIHH